MYVYVCLCFVGLLFTNVSLHTDDFDLALTRTFNPAQCLLVVNDVDFPLVLHTKEDFWMVVLNSCFLPVEP